MIPITVCNHKGGTGKTTSTMMIAAAFGLSGRRVLAIDLDPQAFLSRMMGVSNPDPELSTCSLFTENAGFREDAVVHFDGFDLLPASSRLSAQMRQLHRSVDVFWVKEYAEKYLGSWDLVFFDTAAALTVFSLNALVASRYTIIPVLPEYQPVVGAEQTFQTAATVQKKLNPHMQDVWFLLTMVDGRKRNHAAYADYMRKRYDRAVLDGVIRTNTSLSTTRHDGRTPYDLDPHGRGAKDYAALADELTVRLDLPPIENPESA